MTVKKKPQDHKDATQVETHRVAVVDGVEWRLEFAGLRSPRTADDLGLLQEVAELGENAPKEYLAEMQIRVPGLLRRLVGLTASRKVHAHLEGVHGDEYSMVHLAQFIVSLFKAAAPN
jgi:hypothetical protein